MTTSFVQSGGLGTATDASSYLSGTVTAAEGDWVVVAVMIAQASPVPTVTGVSGAVLGAMTSVVSVADSGTIVRLHVWKKKVGVGGIAEALTATLSGTALRGVVIPIVVSGANATDVVQGSNYDTDSSASANTLQCALAAFQAGGSVLVFGLGHEGGYNLTFEAAYTAGTQINSGEALRGRAAWLVGTQDTAVDVNFSSTNIMAAAALEIATAASGIPAGVLAAILEDEGD